MGLGGLGWVGMGVVPAQEGRGKDKGWGLAFGWSGHRPDLPAVVQSLGKEGGI